MAENKMNNPEQERNLGGNEGQQQRAPGRNLNENQSAGQRGRDDNDMRTGQREEHIEEGGGGRRGYERQDR